MDLQFANSVWVFGAADGCERTLHQTKRWLELLKSGKYRYIYIYIYLYFERGVLCKLVQAFEHKGWVCRKAYPDLWPMGQSEISPWHGWNGKILCHSAGWTATGDSPKQLPTTRPRGVRVGDLLLYEHASMSIYVDFSYISLSVMQVTNPKLANAASGNEISSSLPLSLSDIVFSPDLNGGYIQDLLQPWCSSTWWKFTWTW